MISGFRESVAAARSVFSDVTSRCGIGIVSSACLFACEVGARGTAVIMNFGAREKTEMATIIEFPATAAPRRARSGASRATMGTVVILPVVRIEREMSTDTSDDRGPREGAAPSRRRRRR